MSSTVPTTPGITQVLEAPISSNPLVARSPPQSPGHPPLPPALSLSSLASPSLFLLVPPHMSSTPPQYSTLSADSSITLIDPDTLKPILVDSNLYIVHSPSLPTPAPTLNVKAAMGLDSMTCTKTLYWQQVIKQVESHLGLLRMTPEFTK